jgi:hypothetical protein
MSITREDIKDDIAVDDDDVKKTADVVSVGGDSEDDSFTNALLISAEDASGNDAKYVTTRKELWSYYTYYIGNSGLGAYSWP